MSPTSVAVLGSTGSIGTQASAIIASHPDLFTVRALASAGSNLAELERQVTVHHPEVVAIADDDAARQFTQMITSLPPAQRPEVLAGEQAATQAAQAGADIVLNGITGSVGLAPTLAALASGATLALANKESLVVGGALVKAAQRRPDQIVPVDSEHSAIAQAMRGGRHSEVRRLILTASGGPFRGRTRAELTEIGVDQALAHPTWSMGPVITINSATLVNKALELIEAHLLFDVPTSDIEVVVHPQSVVHSMVEFHDGATLALASPPTMAIPLALGLSWPDRLADVAPACDWSQPAAWQFEPVDHHTFPAIELARAAAAASPTHPAVFNAANEECVAAFLAGRIRFLDIVDTVTDVLSQYTPSTSTAAELTLEEVIHAERWARMRACEHLAKGH